MIPKRFLRRARHFSLAILARGFLQPLRLLPYRLLQMLLPNLVGPLAYWSVGRIAEQNLQRAFGDELQPTERRRIARAVCRNMGRLVAEVLAMHRRNGTFFDASTQTNGLAERIAEGRDKGRGLIFVSAHLGNWEYAGHLLHRTVPQAGTAVIGRRLSNSNLDAMVVSHRAKSHLTTVYQDESPRRLLRLLKENQMLAIVPDQDIAGIDGIFIHFFGQPAFTPTGPAWIALHSGAPIIPGGVIRTSRGLEVVMGETIWPNTDATDRATEIERLTQGWSQAIEALIRQHREQWMWFHRRWKTTPDRLQRRGRGRNIKGPALSSP
jgi:KDO2-lipid IV(A) lauroyltransferase